MKRGTLVMTNLSNPCIGEMSRFSDNSSSNNKIAVRHCCNIQLAQPLLDDPHQGTHIDKLLVTELDTHTHTHTKHRQSR